jgi:hypothetical protein
MKLEGPLGNVPKKMLLDIFRTVSPFSRVQFIMILPTSLSIIHIDCKIDHYLFTLYMLEQEQHPL